MLILLYLKKEKVENMKNGNNSRLIFTDLDFSEWKIKALTETFLQEDDISYFRNHEDKRFGRILHEDYRGDRFYLHFDKKHFNVTDAYLKTGIAGIGVYNPYLYELRRLAIVERQNNQAYLNML